MQPLTFREDYFALATFDHLEGGIANLFGMHLAQCRVCATEWRVVEAGRIHDVWILFRGWANRPVVDTGRGLLALAVEMGTRVRDVDRQVSMEIPAAIENLAKETPGIAVGELAWLPLIPPDVLRFHAGGVWQDLALNIGLEN